MITSLLKMKHVNTNVRCKPRNTTNFNQKVKMLKCYAGVTLSKLYYNILKTSKFTSFKKLLKSIIPTGII